MKISHLDAWIERIYAYGMRKILLGSLAVLAIGGYFAWNYLNHSIGDQKVSYEPSKMECGTGKSGAWKYCLHSAQQGTNGGLAYLLHGRNLDERVWNDDTYYTALIQRYWKDSGKKPPVIAVISFGPTWLLAPKNSASQSGLLEAFEKEVIPEIEAKTGAPKYRAVFGDSMGGLNTLIAGLSTKNLFQKLASLCPVVYKDSPFSSLATLKKAAERTGAAPAILFSLRPVAKAYAGTEEEWSRINPLALVDHFEGGTAEFYISAPLYDKYGNFEGTEALVRKMQGKGIKTSWHPLYGGHCAIDVVSLADFLI